MEWLRRRCFLFGFLSFSWLVVVLFNGFLWVDLIDLLKVLNLVSCDISLSLLVFVCFFVMVSCVVGRVELVLSLMLRVMISWDKLLILWCSCRILWLVFCIVWWILICMCWLRILVMLLFNVENLERRSLKVVLLKVIYCNFWEVLCDDFFRFCMVFLMKFCCFLGSGKLVLVVFFLGFLRIWFWLGIVFRYFCFFWCFLNFLNKYLIWISKLSIVWWCRMKVLDLRILFFCLVFRLSKLDVLF